MDDSFDELRERMALYPLLRPLIFSLDAERAHKLSIAALKALPVRRAPTFDPVLASEVAGLRFPSPVGLAAGYDKDAEVFGAMLGLGFGAVEVGTLTPKPQPGNPRPRSFRLAEDRAAINRYGFNSCGQAAALGRLQRRNKGAGIVGINLGANKDSADRIADYVLGVRAMARHADYLTVNISSPNTPGLRALQDRAALEELVSAVTDAAGGAAAPIFLKVAPDLERGDIDDIAAIAVGRLDGLIVSNTTVTRPRLASRHGGEAGGLSGAPLKELALERLRDFRSGTGGQIPLIAAGGIESGADAFARIVAGASLVQFYSALVYEGPGLAKRMASELKALLEREGFTSINEAVGSAARA